MGRRRLVRTERPAVRAGILRVRELGAGAVVVLGHPSCRPRSGFRPATELEPGSLKGRGGTIRQHPAFRDL